ncbi:pyruvate kinase-like protein [Aspergillus pseudoustus]|uniref:Pyruvate kinase-like protein n=1 Tax=Aspergillus pseudoustus TaxID=1810923 RepID=A0ABR4J5X4_9EURO
MATVLSTTLSGSHVFSKPPAASIKLIPGLGIEGDCHFGETVQHRSRLHIKPPPANLRQVHLIPIEILEKVSSTLSATEKTELLAPGALGQNITTQGTDLLSLSVGTELHFEDASGTPAAGPVIVLTGLRNPCPQIDKFQPGLKERFVVRDAQRKIVQRLAGVMATVQAGGEIRAGMRIRVVSPAEHVALGPV